MEVYYRSDSYCLILSADCTLLLDILASFSSKDVFFARDAVSKSVFLLCAGTGNRLLTSNEDEIKSFTSDKSALQVL